MKWFKCVWLLVALLFLNGCSGTRIDARDDARLKISLAKIKSELTEQEWKDFQLGMSSIRRTIQDSGAEFVGGDGTVDKKFRDRIQGQSAQWVVSQGKRFRRIEQDKVREMFPHIDLPE